MAVEIGKIFEGKVSGITKFGAFVELDDGVNGLVHISEISDSFVNDINDILKVGDKVKVKVIKINDEGKISLSIRQADVKPNSKNLLTGNREENHSLSKGSMNRCLR